MLAQQKMTSPNKKNPSKQPTQTKQPTQKKIASVYNQIVKEQKDKKKNKK